MASKMQNWIEHQRRNLSASDFDAWVGGNVKVQSYLARQEKIPAAVRALDDLQRQILKKVIGPGLDKASKYLAGVEKQAAPSEAGVLRQSIGSIPPRLYEATFTGYVASGPRRGYGRVVLPMMTKNGRVKLKRMSKKASEAMPQATKKVPTYYARFVIRGRKAITSKKTMMTSAGKFLGHHVAEAKARDFMASAWSQSDAAANLATQEMAARSAELTQPTGG